MTCLPDVLRAVRNLTWVVSAVSAVAFAGDVGGKVFSSPGTLTLRLEWGSNFQNSKEINVTGDGDYKFGVRLRNNTTYRVVGKAAPAGWACRAKHVETYLTSAGATNTNVYCASTTSAGVRVAAWNLEWFDSADAPEKKQAVADIINQYNFDVVLVNEVLDAASWDDFVKRHLGNATDWDYRISEAGCSLKQVTMWRKSEVTFESGYDLNCATTNCIIDESGATWDDCGGRRPYVANFAVNNSDVKFTTATIHFKAYTTPSDCQVRKDQVDSFVAWYDWAGMAQKNFIAAGDYNDTLPGSGNCSTIDTLYAMEADLGTTFVTAQPGYAYSHMMGNGLVTYDTKSFQNTIDHFWVTNSLFQLLDPSVDTYGNRANAVQANFYFSSHEEPDHNPPFIEIRR